MAEDQQLPKELKKKLNLSGFADFFNNETLSDISVVNPQTGAQYK